jgi:hypothetical protein
MKKIRDFPPLAKPHFDEAAVLAFASAQSRQEQPATAPNESDGQIQVIVPLSPKLFAALQKEATRKGRSAADLIRKIVAKHLDKD